MLIRYLLPFIFLFSACSTYKDNYISNNDYSFEKKNEMNVNLPYLDKDELILMEHSEQSIIKKSSVDLNPLLIYLNNNDTMVIDYSSAYLNSELVYNYPLEYLIPEEKIATKIVKAELTVTELADIKLIEVVNPKLPVNKIVVPEKIEKTATKTVESVKKEIASVPAAKEQIVNDIEEIVKEYKETISAVINEPFTIEMDPTGWIFEDDIPFIIFRNKFYTSSGVLFEFIPEKEGAYEIIFKKYSRNLVEITTVPVKINFNVVEDEKVNYTKAKESMVFNSKKEEFEYRLKDISNDKNPDEIYFNLAQIYYQEGQIIRAKELYQEVYNNYPLSKYSQEAKEQIDYIIDNFLFVQ